MKTATSASPNRVAEVAAVLECTSAYPTGHTVRWVSRARVFPALSRGVSFGVAQLFYIIVC